jgi:transcription elongation factor Elf1
MDPWKNGFWSRFSCPLCGSRKYVRVRVQKQSGHWYVTEFYECFACSVMFRDPVLFTRCRVDTLNDERTPGRAHGADPQEPASPDPSA